MNYIRGIINIVVGLGIFLFGCFGLHDYFSGAEQKLEKYETLLNEGKVIIGTVDSDYTEITIKGTQFYTSKYSFEVDGKKYKETFSFDSPSELTPTIEVHYMPNNPEVSDVDVVEKLALAEKNKDSTIGLWLGIGMSLLGLAVFYFKGIRRFRKPKEKQTDTEQSNPLKDKDFV